MLTAISPIDGRYANKTEELSDFFSEYALIKYRVYVEIHYFIKLLSAELPALKDFPSGKIEDLRDLADQFSVERGAGAKLSAAGKPGD